MWSHKSWQGRLFSVDAQPQEFLSQYASVFQTVEGNTTFYAIPSEASVALWSEVVPRGFKFSFKMPKLITHDLKLKGCELSIKTFFDRMSPIHDRMGPIMIQLPASVSPKHLSLIEAFVKQLPCHFPYAIEVRHPDFFDAGVNEKALINLLKRYRIDRVCFDSRALFASKSRDEYTLDAQKKKPKLPVHAMAIGKHPMVRFVGDIDYELNDSCLDHWIKKLVHWMSEGKEPYVFMHMADNTNAPALARHFHQKISEVAPEVGDLPIFPSTQPVGSDEQMDLF
ncbi:Uncharacterised protein [BD1-7 clade bacterium]|uniref:DUF72 domain-containing protein n=1 Tax=BD1-7 clade bacterium TaxID=2029982 RepID=A0A5S9NNA3_9GAMM|nr:Uncharacterised protein [BD1-7 clade bacterium]CAA0094816.1 Uncharacterised protein [BD1-7 clade bacterium]